MYIYIYVCICIYIFLYILIYIYIYMWTVVETYFHIILKYCDFSLKKKHFAKSSLARSTSFVTHMTTWAG